MKVSTQKTNRPVPFHMVKLRSQFRFQGKTYIKFAPKKGMASDGSRCQLTDNTLVARV